MRAPSDTETLESAYAKFSDYKFPLQKERLIPTLKFFKTVGLTAAKESEEDRAKRTAYLALIFAKFLNEQDAASLQELGQEFYLNVISEITEKEDKNLFERFANLQTNRSLWKFYLKKEWGEKEDDELKDDLLDICFFLELTVITLVKISKETDKEIDQELFELLNHEIVFNIFKIPLKQEKEVSSRTKKYLAQEYQNFFLRQEAAATDLIESKLHQPEFNDLVKSLEKSKNAAENLVRINDFIAQKKFQTLAEFATMFELLNKKFEHGKYEESDAKKMARITSLASIFVDFVNSLSGTEDAESIAKLIDNILQILAPEASEKFSDYNKEIFLFRDRWKTKKGQEITEALLDINLFLDTASLAIENILATEQDADKIEFLRKISEALALRPTINHEAFVKRYSALRSNLNDGPEDHDLGAADEEDGGEKLFKDFMSDLQDLIGKSTDLNFLKREIEKKFREKKYADALDISDYITAHPELIAAESSEVKSLLQHFVDMASKSQPLATEQPTISRTPPRELEDYIAEMDSENSDPRAEREISEREIIDALISEFLLFKQAGEGLSPREIMTSFTDLLKDPAILASFLEHDAFSLSDQIAIFEIYSPINKSGKLSDKIGESFLALLSKVSEIEDGPEKTGYLKRLETACEKSFTEEDMGKITRKLYPLEGTENVNVKELITKMDPNKSPRAQATTLVGTSVDNPGPPLS